MQLINKLVACVALAAVALVPSEGAATGIASQVTNMLRGQTTVTCGVITGCLSCCGPTQECCLWGWTACDGMTCGN